MRNITRFALVSMLLLGNVNAVSAVETVDSKDSIEVEKEPQKQGYETANFDDKFLYFVGVIIVGGLNHAIPEMLNEKKRKFVKNKLTEYKIFSKNGREMYLEMIEGIEEIQIETGYQNRVARNLLEEFNDLLEKFLKEIGEVEFLYTELNFEYAKERLLERKKISNKNKIEVSKASLSKGLYDEEALDIEGIKNRLESLWQEIVSKYQSKPNINKIEWLLEVWSEFLAGKENVNQKEWLAEALSTRTEEGEPIFRDACGDCENLIGSNWNGKQFVCIRHPFGQYNCSDYRSIQQESEETLSGCSGCENFHGRDCGGNFLVCAIHPSGREDCPDYKPYI